ncbi:hypothetical protein RBSH_01187 [Rhodopirellula baltica SH28]|uniref:Uncharacterized protein n=2 Tax=Rhodopirellula baltica TaxID=265606 RepID=K5D9R2_RHOBT|nr:hypothetical protein RBSH_01187 [Rhodopirellula baltica SH28]ELP29466.1 hypothetical protein RBSWK_06543 [Rhodopirellula baltica SWK14]
MHAQIREQTKRSETGDEKATEKAVSHSGNPRVGEDEEREASPF